MIRLSEGEAVRALQDFQGLDKSRMPDQKAVLLSLLANVDKHEPRYQRVIQRFHA